MTADNSKEYYWLCPLYSFDCYSESVDLIDGVQIKRISQELSEFLEENRSELFWTNPSDAKWMLSIPYPQTAKGDIKSVFGEWERIKNLLFDLITALRLCHAGTVTAGTGIQAHLGPGKSTFAFTLIITQAFDLRPEMTYKLSQSDALDIKALLKKMRKMDKEGKLDSIDAALRRFNFSYYGEEEDRLIDQMIAFESLYIGDDKELGYKLAIRTAFLLGDKKANIFSDLRKAYKLRGQIVHGTKNVNWSTLKEILPKTEDYLRQSIRKFLLLLSQGHSLKGIRDKLDENILKNGALLA
jgi:hypothetical protein